jgi:hypothetical protein
VWQLSFEGVCQGATVSKATPYVATGAAHEVILFSPNDGKLYEDTSTLPTDWTVQFDTKSDAYAKVDTVACVDVTSQQMVKECTGYTHVEGRSDCLHEAVRPAVTGTPAAVSLE